MRTFGLFLWVSAFAISSCKTQHTVTTERDTVVITQTRTLVDTLEIYKDTIVYKDRVKFKIEYRDSLVNVQVDCPSDTVRIRQTIIKNNTEELERQSTWIGTLFTICLVLFILVLLKK